MIVFIERNVDCRNSWVETSALLGLFFTEHTLCPRATTVSLKWLWSANYFEEKLHFISVSMDLFLLYCKFYIWSLKCMEPKKKQKKWIRPERHSYIKCILLNIYLLSNLINSQRTYKHKRQMKKLPAQVQLKCNISLSEGDGSLVHHSPVVNQHMAWW